MKGLKHITLFLFFSWIITDLYSQTYHPFPDSSAIWRMEYCYLPSPISPPSCSWYSYFINGDTVINGKTYSKIYQGDVNATDSLNALFMGAIREDTNNRVYLFADSIAFFFNQSFCNNNDLLNKEVLLYDYGVSVGDTVFYQYLDSSRIYIASIDSILIQNQYLKKYNYYFITPGGSNCPWYINGLNNGSYYLEKIGHHSGLFEPYLFYANDDWNNILCFEDSEISYPDSTSCYISMGINEKIPEENVVLVYPNPNNGLFTLKIDAPFSQATLAIFDVAGRHILKQKINQTKTQLNLLAYPNGMYFYQVIVEGKVFFGKVMVN